MAITLEYLKRRCDINERVLHDLGLLIASHLPALQPQLKKMGEAWDAAIDNLDAEIPKGPDVGAYYEINID